MFADSGEQRGRRGHIHHHGIGIARLQACGQAGVVFGFGQVHADKFQDRGKAGKFFGAGALGQFDLVEARLDQTAVLRIGHVVPAYADNATAFGQGAMAKRLKQGRHQLAPS